MAEVENGATPESKTVGGYINPILKAPMGGKDTIDMDQARIVAVAYAAAGVAVGSVVARDRQRAGKEPFLKVFL